MAIEIEKKYRVTTEQFARVADDLAQMDAEYEGEVFEENLLFGNEFLEDDKSLLRVRRVGDDATLTFKKSILNFDGVKKHVEYETKVADGAELIKVLENIGFTMLMVYEKRRRTWKFRSVEVVLDELPFGLFMEIEGEMMAIAEAEMFLGADEFEYVEMSYPFLTKNFGKIIEGRIEARFE